MIYLLDTNIISEFWKPKPAPEVLQFRESVEWRIPSVVIAEIQEGAEASPSATRREEINSRLTIFLERNSGVVIPWDAQAARTWGRLKHSPEVKKQPQALWDSIIDALAVSCGMIVATRNEGDFRHADTFNPFPEKPSGKRPA